MGCGGCGKIGRMRYAYLGPEGTFTEAAVASLGLGAAAVPVPYPTVSAALTAIRAGQAERGVIPMESSVEGIVTATVDDLTAGGGLRIHGETSLPIAFSLLAAPGTTLADVKTVGGHPHSQPQCRRWLSENLPHAEWVAQASNGEGARKVAEGRLDAALAGEFAAAKYGISVLASDVHDNTSAVTRFVVVAPESVPGPEPTRADRTSVAAFLRDDRPGALMEILTEFAVRGINLTTIQSRPTGSGLGSYFFFIDCEGHIHDTRVGEAMMGLRRVCAEVRFLGSYPRCDGGRTHVRPGTSDAEFASAAAWLARLRDGRRVLQIRPGAAVRRLGLILLAGGHEAGRERPPHLLKLGPCRHLLREQRGLDAVEQAFEPSDELGLGDPQFGLAGRGVVRERQRQPLKLLDELGSETVFQFLYGTGVDLLETGAALLVQRCGTHLLEQLPDHAADAHDLGGLLDHFYDRALAVAFGLVRSLGTVGAGDRSEGHATRADHYYLRIVFVRGPRFSAHLPHVTCCPTATARAAESCRYGWKPP